MGYDQWLEAPYTDQPEAEECDQCCGTGLIDYGTPGLPDNQDSCDRCDGTGYVDPPTREEIKETRDEIRGEEMRDA